jgi:hypothetical protein
MDSSAQTPDFRYVASLRRLIPAETESAGISFWREDGVLFRKRQSVVGHSSGSGEVVSGPVIQE